MYIRPTNHYFKKFHMFLNPVDHSPSSESLPVIHSIYPATSIRMNYIGPITPRSSGLVTTVVPCD